MKSKTPCSWCKIDGKIVTDIAPIHQGGIIHMHCTECGSKACVVEINDLGKEHRRLMEISKKAKALSDLIVGSFPGQTIKGEIESLAFDLSHDLIND